MGGRRVRRPGPGPLCYCNPATPESRANSPPRAPLLCFQLQSTFLNVLRATKKRGVSLSLSLSHTHTHTPRTPYVNRSNVSRRFGEPWEAHLVAVKQNSRNALRLAAQAVRLFATPCTVARQAPLPVGILQTRTLEWVAMPSSRGSS